ncbi:MAG: hypothetical protein KJP00_10970, partial [Bacteroidia bacterium]|nr:hypothetical protein [Bacteroidia bacterium]
EQYSGEIIMYYGDGTLSIFDSAIDAVQCSIEMQREMQEGLTVPLRIGIHSGDIVIEEDDIVGDSVNLASRIESLASVGSVLISDKVYDDVKNNPKIQTTFLKTFNLKNIEEPTDVYAISNPGLVVPDPETMTGKLEKEKIPFFSLKNKMLIPSIISLLFVALLAFWGGSFLNKSDQDITSKKIAVIPLAYDFSAGDEEEYFQSGMTEALITELSKIKGLFVINRPSTQVLLGGVGVQEVLVNDVVKDIDYFINGDLEKDQNEISVKVFLSKEIDGDLLFEKNYTTDISEIRTLWRDVSVDLAGQMGILSEEEANRRIGLKSVKPETYELYLKGIHYMNQSNPMDMSRGMTYMQEAIDQNPSDPYAYAGLAEAYVRLGHGPAPPPDVFPKALAAAQRAIQLDSTCAEGWAALAHYHTYFGKDWELAEYAFNKADELNPNMAYNHYHRAWYLALFGRMNEAIEEHQLAQELDPFIPLHTAWLGELYRWVGEYDKALAEVEKSSQMVEYDAIGNLVKGWIYIDQGKVEEGIAALRKAAEINIGFKYIGLAPVLARVGNTDEAKAIAQELEAAPPTGFGALCLGSIYAHLKDNDKALQCLQFEQKHGWYPWIRVLFMPEAFKNDERFLKLIRDMNLPDPAPLDYDPEL